MSNHDLKLKVGIEYQSNRVSTSSTLKYVSINACIHNAGILCRKERKSWNQWEKLARQAVLLKLNSWLEYTCFSMNYATSKLNAYEIRFHYFWNVSSIVKAFKKERCRF